MSGSCTPLKGGRRGARCQRRGSCKRRLQRELPEGTPARSRLPRAAPCRGSPAGGPRAPCVPVGPLPEHGRKDGTTRAGSAAVLHKPGGSAQGEVEVLCPFHQSLMVTRSRGAPERSCVSTRVSGGADAGVLRAPEERPPAPSRYSSGPSLTRTAFSMQVARREGRRGVVQAAPLPWCADVSCGPGEMSEQRGHKKLLKCTKDKLTPIFVRKKKKSSKNTALNSENVVLTARDQISEQFCYGQKCCIPPSPYLAWLRTLDASLFPCDSRGSDRNGFVKMRNSFFQILLCHK